MEYMTSNEVHFIFPLNLFNNEYFFFKNKTIIIKYIFFKSFKTIYFIKSVKHLNNTYHSIIKLRHNIKKSNIKSRSNLSMSTKKLFSQKGLGKARSGSLKSPLRRGGSTLFGPLSRKLFFILQRKKKKLSFFYLFLNKRTYISIVFITPSIHKFNNIIEYLDSQQRIKGIFSKKLLYVIFPKITFILDNKYSFININSLNIDSFLNFDYIIFLL